jgi:asparagine synthase (glutamine-hydrolysing)
MCGIAGFYDYQGQFGPDRIREIANAMNETIAHRGPDDSGVWVDETGRCALAQRRLSIVDLSAQGHQPMVEESGEATITFNGEIYNFQELRKRLASQGASFKSRCDTEVVLRLLSDLIPDRISALRGMFALAVWNRRKQQLLLARDPFGKKPLYVARGNGWFAFASELQAFECIPEFDRTISADALSEYLLVQYLHAPTCIYKGAQKLPPGSYLQVNHHGIEQCNPYYEFDAGAPSPDITLDPSYEGRLEQLDALIDTAVSRRMISDVPLGAFLSSGVDSALIVARMRRLGNVPTTFSVGFTDSPDSEHVAAREIAEHLGCEHHEITVRPDAIEMAPQIANALDEPNGDSSCLPTKLLCEFTRQHVTVALSGDGGDEMFGGYGRYTDVIREGAADDRPESWSASEAYLGVRWTIFQLEQIEKFLGHVPERARRMLERWSSILERGDRPLIHRMRTVDTESYLPGSVLAKVDRMSMQYALEVRCPLLDVDVANFAAALSADDCVTRKNSGQASAPDITVKRMLRDLLARDLPRPWVDRKKKGFGLPEAFWDGAALRDFSRDLLDSPSTQLRNYFDTRALRDWLTTQEDPNFFSIYRMWPMLILELWLRKPRQAVTG